MFQNARKMLYIDVAILTARSPMFTSPSYSRPYLLISYFILSVLPLFAWLNGKELGHPGRLVAYEIIAWIAMWAFFKSPRWFHLLLLPAFLAAPIEIYLRLYYNQGISTHHLGIITETSPKEAAEFLGNKIWLLILIIFFISGWWLSLWQAAKKTPELSWNHWSRWIVISLFVLASGPWLLGQYFGVASASASNDSEKSAPQKLSSVHNWTQLMAWADEHEPLPSWAEALYDEESFSKSWPLGIYARGYDYILERRYLNKLSEKNREFRFHAKQAAGNDFQQTIVVVIGESSRYDRWSINGYDRETNPYLSQEENLVSFSDMISAVAATRLSVPIITTRKPAAQSLKAGFAEKSFLSAYKEAGFKTFWISNQMSFGQFDTPTSVIAKEADVTQFLNFGGFTNTSSYDQVLLQPLQNALEDTAPNKLIVLHTLGNHWNYSHRHPKEYDKWKPSLFGVANPAYTNLKNKQLISNSYDNSILYMDWVLARAITQLKALPHMSAMFYVSDHGQTLYDGSCNLAFHGHNTQFEFHVPAFVWYSDQFAAQHPQKIAQLKQHQHEKLSTENVFHSLLDMVDIRYPDEKLDRSIFSEKLRFHTRYVDSYGWSNYDNASFKGDCREVIDLKEPLPQEK